MTSSAVRISARDTTHMIEFYDARRTQRNQRVLNLLVWRVLNLRVWRSWNFTARDVRRDYNAPMWRSAGAIVVVVVTLVSVSGEVRAPGQDWQPQTSGVDVRLRGLSAVTTRIAWASGANGTVLRTVNAGQT